MRPGTQLQPHPHLHLRRPKYEGLQVRGQIGGQQRVQMPQRGGGGGGHEGGGRSSTCARISLRLRGLCLGLQARPAAQAAVDDGQHAQQLLGPAPGGGIVGARGAVLGVGRRAGRTERGRNWGSVDSVGLKGLGTKAHMQP